MPPGLIAPFYWGGQESRFLCETFPGQSDHRSALTMSLWAHGSRRPVAARVRLECAHDVRGSGRGLSSDSGAPCCRPQTRGRPAPCDRPAVPADAVMSTPVSLPGPLGRLCAGRAGALAAAPGGYHIDPELGLRAPGVSSAQPASSYFLGLSCCSCSRGAYGCGVHTCADAVLGRRREVGATVHLLCWWGN